MRPPFKWVSKLANLLGINIAELAVVAVLVMGLLIGLLYKLAYSPEPQNTLSQRSIDAAMDSLERLEKAKNNDTIFIEQTEDEIVASTKTIKASFNGIVNINTASESELTQLHGIGPAKAEQIIAYRKNKPFRRKADILNVPGIGPAAYEKIKSNIEV